MENVSIVIPAIKWEAFSEKCVTTCARLFPSATLILVLDECSPLALSFDNLIVLYGITGTISKKRNVGVEAAKTEFIAFIDSDAFPHSAWLSSAVKTLESKTNVGLLGGPNISPLEQESERNLVGLACKSWLVAGSGIFINPKNLLLDIVIICLLVILFYEKKCMKR
jgi:glycosyltransferase involved in cell wall biosynthesis